jgi:uncharacterized membrane protein YdjX (TVP38/TMEM64 family)/membrane-associated phospholipid phosphatase
MDPDKRHPPSLSPRALAIAGWSACVAGGALFLAIASNISGESGLIAFDERVSQWLQARHSAPVVSFLLAVTHLNSTAAIGLWSCAFGIVLARLREGYWMLTLAASVGGAMLLNLALKSAYERLRPRFEPPLLMLETYSFPSGHTAAAVAFYGVLAAFLVSRFYDLRRRVACVSVAVAAVALVAFSRVYLGAHYLSDVLAAVCSSTVWLVLCLAGGHALVRGRLRRLWLVVAAVVLLGLLAAALLPLENWSQKFQAALAEMDFATGFLAFCAVNVLAALLFVPAWIFPIAAGAVFGIGWGLAAALAGALLAAITAFLLARYALRRVFGRLARRHESFKAMDAAVAKEGWKVIALLRMSPLMPSGLKSYFLGLTRVRLAQYVGASALGMLPGIALKVYVGAAGRGALANGGVLEWSLFAAGLAATVGLAFVLGRSARKRLNWGLQQS